MANNKDEPCRLVVSIGKSADSCFLMGRLNWWAIGVNLNPMRNIVLPQRIRMGHEHIPRRIL